MKKSVFLSLLLCGIYHPASADFMTYGIKVECMPELNLLVLSNEFYPGYTADKYLSSHREEAIEKYHFYSFNVQKTEGQNSALIEPQQYKFNCMLNNHNIEVEIQPDEVSFNSDENSGCTYASYITIKDNEKIISDRLRTYDCDRDVYVSRLTLRPQVEIPDYSNGGVLFLNGYNGDRQINEYYYYDRVKYDPVNSINFYEQYPLLPKAENKL